MDVEEVASIRSSVRSDFIHPSFCTPVREQAVGGRLQEYWENWTVIGADPWVIRTLKCGYTIEFEERPPLSREVLIDSTPANPVKKKAMAELVLDLLEKNVIEIVQKQSPGHISRFFIVPKKDTGKWRAILDLKTVNGFVAKEKFKMETAENISEHLKQGEFATSYDLSDAYHHIPVAVASRKFLRFFFQGKLYQYRGLPMGLTTSPRIFTRIIKVIREYFQRQSITLHQYLDDWLTHAASYSVVQDNTRSIVEVTQQLGFLINFKKSELVPKKEFCFLGYLFKLDMGIVVPTEERWEKIQKKILRFLSVDSVEAEEWQSLLGVLAATEKLVKLGMLHMRPIQVGLLDQWSPFWGNPKDYVPVFRKWSRLLYCGGQCMRM